MRCIDKRTAMQIAESAGYGVAERALGGRGIRRRINGSTIMLPVRFARFYPRTYEIAKHRFLCTSCRPGATVLDLGAHLGLFSVAMARAVGDAGRVFAFEPAPGVRKALQQTVRLNGCQEIIEVRHEAIGGVAGRAALVSGTGPLSNAGRLDARSADRLLGQLVDVVTVDAFTAARDLRVDCMKIDVEGSEFDVLAGARATIARDRPAIALEVHPSLLAAAGRDLGELRELAQPLGLEPACAGSPITWAQVALAVEPFELELCPAQ